MTEKQLWQYLADLWAMPSQFELKRASSPCVQPVPGDPIVRGHEFCFGLCQCLARLHDSHDINGQVFENTGRRLTAFLQSNKWNGGYFYDLTPDGAQKRHALCSRFAAEVIW